MAVEAVREGTDVATAEKTFKVPRSTLRDKLSRRRQSAKRPEVKTVFTTKQGPALVDRLICVSDRGFPLTLTSCIFFYSKIESASATLKANNCKLETSFQASYDWFLAFKKRRPQLALRVPEVLSKGRAEPENKEQKTSNDTHHFS